MWYLCSLYHEEIWNVRRSYRKMENYKAWRAVLPYVGNLNDLSCNKITIAINVQTGAFFT